jgi:hypothetical protein
MDDLWQIDLADLQKISKYNDNNRYLVIDIFSKLHGLYLLRIKIRDSSLSF